MLREIKVNPKQTVVELNKKLCRFSGTVVTDSAVRKNLKSNGYSSCIARCKPLLSEINIKKRLEFAKKYRYESIEFWKKVIFIDEIKFNIYHSDGKQQRVWRKQNEALKRKNIAPSVKHGGGNVMVWGAVGYHGVVNMEFIQETMNQHIYINILKRNLAESARKNQCERDFYFYQDNDPKHKAWNTKMWLLYNCPHVIETPPQSPDLSPIEHLWEHLDRKVRINQTVSNKSTLMNAISTEWERIDPDVTMKLVESMPRRLEAVIKAKGHHTKY